MWDNAAGGFVNQGGLQGANGAVFTPSVAADGTLSWTNDGGLENPAAVNIKGPKGEPGANGADGTNGTDGRTPVKGQDYFTAADKNEMIASIKNSIFVFDANTGRLDITV